MIEEAPGFQIDSVISIHNAPITNLSSSNGSIIWASTSESVFKCDVTEKKISIFGFNSVGCMKIMKDKAYIGCGEGKIHELGLPSDDVIVATKAGYPVVYIDMVNSSGIPIDTHVAAVDDGVPCPLCGQNFQECDMVLHSTTCDGIAVEKDDSQLLLFVDKRAIRVYIRQEEGWKRVSKTSFEFDVKYAKIVELCDYQCVVVHVCDYLHIYTLNDLELVKSIKIPDSTLLISGDGEVWCNHVYRYNLVKKDALWSVDASFPTLHDSMRSCPPPKKPSGFWAALWDNIDSHVDWIAVFGRAILDIPKTEVNQRDDAREREILSQGRAKAELMRGSNKPNPDPIAEIETRTAVRKKEKSEAAAASSAAMQAHAALVQRGEKLEHLQERTNEMEDAAADFLAGVKSITKAQKDRKWWQL